MADALNQDVPVSYHKSSQFRVVYAEGVFGSVTNRGVIRQTFWNERSALPTQSVIHVVNGQLEGEEQTAGGVGVARELEVEVIMDFGSALAYFEWLSQKLSSMRVALQMPDEVWADIRERVNLK